jgi:hypothetical protein
VLELVERHLAAGTWGPTTLVPRDDLAAGAQMYYRLPCGLGDQALDQLMRRELGGVSLETFRRLTRRQLISAECHRRARQREIAAGIDYDALREQAAAAVWAAVPRPKVAGDRDAKSAAEA